MNYPAWLNGLFSEDEEEQEQTAAKLLLRIVDCHEEGCSTEDATALVDWVQSTVLDCTLLAMFLAGDLTVRWNGTEPEFSRPKVLA